MFRANVGQWEIIQLYYNIFDPIWLVGIEEAVLSVNGNLEIPLA